MMRQDSISLRLFCGRYALVSTCLLAFCVSLGTALVSLAKAIVLIGFFANLVIEKKKITDLKVTKFPKLFIWMLVAVTWMLFSMCWSQATDLTQLQYLYAHSRFLWIGVIYYQIRTRKRGLKVINWLIYGQIFVLIVSWLLWLGFEIPFTRRPTDKGIAFTSSLEQPVMEVLALVVIWNFRDYWIKKWGMQIVHLVMVAFALNLIFIMSGRTGYIALLTVISIEIYKMLPSRFRWIAFLSPVILSAAFYSVSPVFKTRIDQISANTENYLQNKTLSSEGERLDMWKLTFQGALKKPILGFGIGSTPEVYKEEKGLILVPVTQPHQQYLFWWVEFGVIGLIIMLSFFYILTKESEKLKLKSKSSLRSVLALLFMMGMFNCPFFGVGMGEFFFLEIAALLAIKK